MSSGSNKASETDFSFICSNTVCPFTRVAPKDMKELRLISFRFNNFTRCYDIVALREWVSHDNSDPETRLKFSQNQLTRLMREYRSRYLELQRDAPNDVLPDPDVILDPNQNQYDNSLEWWQDMQSLEQKSQDVLDRELNFAIRHINNPPPISEDLEIVLRFTGMASLVILQKYPLKLIPLLLIQPTTDMPNFISLRVQVQKIKGFHEELKECLLNRIQAVKRSTFDDSRGKHLYHLGTSFYAMQFYLAKFTASFNNQVREFVVRKHNLDNDIEHKSVVTDPAHKRSRRKPRTLGKRSASPAGVGVRTQSNEASTGSRGSSTGSRGSRGSRRVRMQDIKPVFLRNSS